MEWTTPSYAEIKMDAEIGSYQNDFDPVDGPEFVSPQSADATDAE